MSYTWEGLPIDEQELESWYAKHNQQHFDRFLIVVALCGLFSGTVIYGVYRLTLWFMALTPAFR